MNKVKHVSIINDDRLRYMIAYVHHNPIHHGLASGFEDWRYSSFKAMSSDEVTLLERDQVYALYGEEEGFQEYHSAFKIEKAEEP